MFLICMWSNKAAAAAAAILNVSHVQSISKRILLLLMPRELMNAEKSKRGKCVLTSWGQENRYKNKNNRKKKNDSLRSITQ